MSARAPTRTFIYLFVAALAGQAAACLSPGGDLAHKQASHAGGVSMQVLPLPPGDGQVLPDSPSDLSEELALSDSEGPEELALSDSEGLEELALSESEGPELSDLQPECLPNCDGLQCGPDGCGGVCGLCPDSKPICTFGKCKKCKPKCDAAQCGDDGCGGVCGVCPESFSCLGGFCKPPACGEGSVTFEETFDSCGQGVFEIIDFQPLDQVMWMGIPSPEDPADCVLYLGDPTAWSYDTGGPVHLKLVSPDIPLNGTGAWKLSFLLRMDAEPAPGPLYPYDHDVLFLYLVDAADPQAEGQLLFSSKLLLNSTGQEFVPVAVDLSPYLGMTVRLLFDFDTLDSIANDHEGVYLDDIRIDPICPYCVEDAECADDQLCSQDACVMFANSPTVGTCSNLAIMACCLGQPETFCDDGDPCTIDACSEESGQCEYQPFPNQACQPSEGAP